jgi:hypothetical protein
MPDPQQEGLKGNLVKGCGLLAVIGFFLLIGGGGGLLILYGVVLLIFRHAFGVEIPDPFSWFR